ncbi:hypothetical protein GGR54DRAFT_634472 [Hypoxylon sp. NC1633]|nr:hypothetical protein GGR54DRAFT_634472 [Hypoxylon sp. NC1633]
MCYSGQVSGAKTRQIANQRPHPTDWLLRRSRWFCRTVVPLPDSDSYPLSSPASSSYLLTAQPSEPIFSIMSSVPEPKFTLLQAWTILYLTTQITGGKNVKTKTIDDFLNVLWPEGLSQGLRQLRYIQSPSPIDEAGEQSDNTIYEAFIQHIRYTRCITPTILKELLVTLHSSEAEPTARYEPEARWTLSQAYDIIHIGNQILLCQNVTVETMDWFVYTLWQDSIQCTRPTDRLQKNLVGPAIRDKFVQLVLKETKITDSILDWLYRALHIKDQSGSNEDGSDTDTLREGMSEKEGPLFGQSSLHYGDHSIYQTRRSSNFAFSDAAASDKENIPPSQSTAVSENWNSSSTTSDCESLNDEESSAIEGGSQVEDAARSLLQCSNSDMPTIVTPITDADSDLTLTHFDVTKSQHGPTKRPRFEDNYEPCKRAKRPGGLIFTISAVHTKRRGGEAEALEFDSKNVTVLVAFPQ